MLKILFIFCILTIFYNIKAGDQYFTGDAFLTDEIIISGNETTQISVIRHYLKFNEGDFISSEQISRAKRNLENSKLFRKVEISRENDGSRNIVRVNLTEEWYFYPLPVLFTHYGDYDKLSAGMNVIHRNFMGFNQEVEASFLQGYQKSANLRYIARDFNNTNWTFTTGLQYKKMPAALKIDSVELETETYSSLIAISRTICDYHNLGIAQGFYKETEPLENRTFKYSSLGITYSYTNVDNTIYPTEGYSFSCGITNSGLGFNSDFDYFTGSISAKKPIAILPEQLDRRLVFAISAQQIDLFGGEIPEYKRLVTGYENKLRCSNQKKDGKHLLQAGVSLKYLIWESPYFTLNWLDGFNNKKIRNILKDLRSSFYGEIYNDNQLTTEKIYDFNKDKISSTAGLSFYAKFPLLNNIARFDMGWNTKEELISKNIKFKFSTVVGI